MNTKVVRLDNAHVALLFGHFIEKTFFCLLFTISIEPKKVNDYNAFFIICHSFAATKYNWLLFASTLFAFLFLLFLIIVFFCLLSILANKLLVISLALLFTLLRLNLNAASKLTFCIHQCFK